MVWCTYHVVKRNSERWFQVPANGRLTRLCRRERIRTISGVPGHKTNTTWPGENKSPRQLYCQYKFYIGRCLWRYKELKLDSGEKITIPNLIRTMVPLRLIKQSIFSCQKGVREQPKTVKSFPLETFIVGWQKVRPHFKDQVVTFSVRKRYVLPAIQQDKKNLMFAISIRLVN